LLLLTLLLPVDVNINGQTKSGGLANGDIFGVIGDSATTGSLAKANVKTAGRAPHGHQYYAMEETGSFAYVRIDPVDVSDYMYVVVKAWVYVSSASWGASDFVVVWANSGDALPSATVGPSEEVLLDGTNVDANVTQGQWVEYSSALGPAFNSTVSVSFGVQSSSKSRAAFFDYVRVLGMGPDRAERICSTNDCPAGTSRSYTSGSAFANCTACPVGQADADSNPNTPCQLCQDGKYAAQMSQAQCTDCPGFPLARSPVGSSAPEQCVTDIAYTSFEEPRTAGTLTRYWYECADTSTGISANGKRYTSTKQCASYCKCDVCLRSQSRGSGRNKYQVCVEKSVQKVTKAASCKGIGKKKKCEKAVCAPATCRRKSEAYIGLYRDTLGGSSSHMLKNNKGQHPVGYAACTLGSKSRELGFRTFYQNVRGSQKFHGGLYKGSVIGVIGDATTAMKGDNSPRGPGGPRVVSGPGGGGKAPHGHQYYAMENTGGFAYVKMDPVSVSAFTGVEMTIWVHIEHTQFWWEDDDAIRVWCKDGTSQKEIVLLEGTDLDASTYMTVGSVTKDRWVEYRAKLTGFASTAIMHFGLQSNHPEEEAWFDYCRVRGTGPDYSPNFCATKSPCPNGTTHAYTAGAPAPICTACPPGKADTDLDPTTPCTDCVVGRYATDPERSECTECPGYPTYALSPVAATSVTQCEYIIGYTSFEEPQLAQLVIAQGKLQIPLYRDTLGGNSNHMLVNNPGENPVMYAPCANGAFELGFKTSYLNTKNALFNQGLHDGAMIGVVSNAGLMQGTQPAPHGKQFYALSDTDGFAYVEIDPVSVAEYSSVEMKAWVRVSKAQTQGYSGWGRADMLKVWGKSVSQQGAHLGQTAGSQKEVVLLEGDDLDDVRRVKTCVDINTCKSSYHIMKDSWTEYSATATGFKGDIVMAFGLQSSEATTSVWFDHFRIFGTGPDRSKLLCPTTFDCPHGTSRAYTVGTQKSRCAKCPPGTADTDSNPGTPCAQCSVGQYAATPGHQECVKCPGFPTHAWSPVAATSVKQCEYTVAYTSFEESHLAPLVTVQGVQQIPSYKDTLGGDTDHMLRNNPGQNPVTYEACSSGTSELGFRSFYSVGNSKQSNKGGLSNGGDIFGVIGDTTTLHRGDGGQGGRAPHGSQYYAMEETGGFAYVEMDSVSIVDYTNVAMKAWVHVENSRWDSHDKIKVWAKDDRTGKEHLLLVGSDLDNVIALQNKNKWMEYGMNLVGFQDTATMAFGLQSDDGSKEAWFDYFRITGTGPDRTSLLCATAISKCRNGTMRAYTAGEQSATCHDCSYTGFEKARTCQWVASRWTREVSTAASAANGGRMAHGGSRFMSLHIKKGSVVPGVANQGCLESPVVAPGMRSMSFAYFQYGSALNELSVDAYFADSTIAGWSTYGKLVWKRATSRRHSGPTQAQNGSHFVELATGSSTSRAEAGYLASSRLTDTASVSFFYHMYGTVGTLSLEALVKQQWTTLWSRTAAQRASRSTPWLHETVSLPTGTTYYYNENNHSACGGSPGRARVPSSLPSILASAAGRWDFTVSLNDVGGQVGNVAVHSKASRTSAGLSLVTGAMALSNRSSSNVSIGVEKTIAAWVTLRSMSVAAGSIISIASVNQYDAIVFAEREPGKWMAGSNGFQRTQDAGGQEEISGQKVFVTIVYSNTQITMYRNGLQYGQPWSTGTSAYKAGSWGVLFGPRVGSDGSIDGVVHSAMLWTRALSAQEVAEAFKVGSKVDWVDRWRPGPGGIDACKAACTASPATCAAFEYSATTAICFWKNESDPRTLTKAVGATCYSRAATQWASDQVRFKGTSATVLNQTSGGIALDTVKFQAELHDPPKVLPSLACKAAVCVHQWKGIGGSDLPSILGNSRYPNNPDTVKPMTRGRFEMQQSGDNLATMLEGFMRAPVTGYYTFSTYSVDESEVRIMLKPNVKGKDTELHTVVELRGGCCRLVVGTDNAIYPVRLVKGEAYYLTAIVKTGGSSSPGGHRRRVQSTSALAPPTSASAGLHASLVCDFDDVSKLCKGWSTTGSMPWSPASPKYRYYPASQLQTRVKYVSWSAARADCQNRGGDLASIHSATDTTDVKAAIRNAGLPPVNLARTNPGVWIGLNDAKSEGTWVWSDDSSHKYRNWIPNNPNDWGNNEDAAVVLSDGRWNDVHLSGQTPNTQGWEATGYVCQQLPLKPQAGARFLSLSTPSGSQTDTSYVTSPSFSGAMELKFYYHMSAPPNTNPALVLQNTGCTAKSKCARCEGDCNSDSDCQVGLKCFQRSRLALALRGSAVPGCRAGGSGDQSGKDFCYSVVPIKSTPKCPLPPPPPPGVPAPPPPPTITFDYHMYGANTGTLSLEAGKEAWIKKGKPLEAGVSWTTAWSKKGQQQRGQNDAWLSSGTVTLPSGTSQVRFKGVRGTGPRGDMSVDNVRTTNGVQGNFESFNDKWKAAGQWRRGTRTPSSGTGPNKAASGRYFYYLEATYGRNFASSYLTSPTFGYNSGPAVATCCDSDQSCDDGDDDWCCGSTFYCSNDGAAYAQSKGGILCPDATRAAQASLSVEQFIGGTWSEVWSHTRSNMTSLVPWISVTETLSPNATKIRFAGARGTMFIDSVTISPAPPPTIVVGSNGESLIVGMEVIQTEQVRPTGVVLLKTGFQCRSSDTMVRAASRLDDCAAACLSVLGCKLFHFAVRGAQQGRCAYEHTLSAACNEGWQADADFNTYTLPWWVTESHKPVRYSPIPTSMFTTIQRHSSAAPPPAPQPPPYGFEIAGKVVQKWMPTGWSVRGNSLSLPDEPWRHGSLPLPAGSTRVRFCGTRTSSAYSPRDRDQMAVDSVNITVAPYVQPRCMCPNGTAAADFTCTMEGEHVCQSCNAGSVIARDRSCIKPTNPCSFESVLQCGWAEAGKQHWTRRSDGDDSTASAVTGASSAHHGMHLLFLETSRGKPGDASYLVSPPLSVYPGFTNFKSISFFYHKFGETTGTLRVEALINASWTVIWTHTGESHAHQKADWSHGQAPLASAVQQVRFMGTRETSDTGDISIDRVDFSDATFVQPKCICENGRAAVGGACVAQGASICQSCDNGLVLAEANTVCALPAACTFETVDMCTWKTNGGAGRWTRVQKSPSLQTGAYRAQRGNYFMVFDAKPSVKEGQHDLYLADQKSYLTSPPIPTGMKKVTFFFLMFGPTMGTLAVEVLNETKSWSTIWSLTGQLHPRPAWLQAEAALPKSASLIRFVGTRGTVTVRGDCAQWSGCTAASAQVYGPGSDISVDTVDFSTVEYVQPVCTCPGGTPVAGTACVLEGAAICLKCHSGLVMSATRSFCAPDGSCTFDGPRGSALCGWKDESGHGFNWARALFKRAGPYIIDKYLTLLGSANGTLASPELIDAKSITFLISMSYSTLSLETTFKGSKWQTVWSRTSSGTSNGWESIIVQLPDGASFARLRGMHVQQASKLYVDNVEVLQQAHNRTQMCACVNGVPYTGADCVPSKAQVCRACHAGYILSPYGQCQAITPACTFDVSTCGWVTSGWKQWVRGARFTQEFPREETGARDAQSGDFFMFLKTAGTYAYGASVEEQARRKDNAYRHRLDPTYLVSPVLSTGVGITMTFQLHMYGANMGTLSLEAYINGKWEPTGWSKTGQIQQSARDEWTTASLALPPSATRVRFVGTTGMPYFPRSNTAAAGVGLYQADMSLDTIRFVKTVAGKLVPTCVCSNGLPKIGSSCPPQGAGRCATCNAGFVLSQWVVENTVSPTATTVAYDGKGAATGISATECRACPAGKYAADTWNCVTCAAGRYSMSPGASACTECSVAAGGYGTPPGAASADSCVQCSSDSACRPGYFCNTTIGPDGTCAVCTGTSGCGCTELLMPNYDAAASQDDGSCTYDSFCAVNKSTCHPTVRPAPCTDNACNPSDYNDQARTVITDSRHAFRFVMFAKLVEETVCNATSCHKSTPAVTPLVATRCRTSIVWASFFSNEGAYGGAIRVEGGELQIVHAEFATNNATEQGGGLHVSNATVSVSHAKFRNNRAGAQHLTTIGQGRGGAIYAAASSIQITYTAIVGNSAAGDAGGAIYVTIGSQLTCRLAIKRSLLMSNVVHRPGGYGGAIAASMGTISIAHGRFRSNSAPGTGGGVWADSSQLTVAHTAFASNAAPSGGNHLYTVRMPYAKISNSQFDPFVNSRGQSVQLAGVLAGCPQHPCQLSEKCTYENYSLSCARCPAKRVSVNGIQCTTCPPGNGPSADQTTCNPCAGNTFSKHGIECVNCSAGYWHNDDHTACNDIDECSPGINGTVLHDCDVLRGTQQKVPPCMNKGGSFDCAACPDGFVDGVGAAAHSCVMRKIDNSSSSTNVLPTATLELAISPQAAVKGSLEQIALKKQLVTDVASALGKPESDFEIKSFETSSTAGTSGRRVQAVAITATVALVLKGSGAADDFKQLTQQLADPTSPLMTGAATSKLIQGQKPVYANTCAGGFEPSADGSQCVACSGGTFSTDGKVCLPCLSGQTATPDATACVCADGYYNQSQGIIRCLSSNAESFETIDYAKTQPETCLSCSELPCVLCTRSGVEVKDANKLVAVDTTARAVFQCPMDTESCRVDSCMPGYSGPLCNNCDEGYSRSGLSGPCSECLGGLNYPIAIGGGLLLMAAIMVLLNAIASTNTSSGKFALTVTLAKIATSMAQILSASQAVFNLNFPGIFRWLLNIIKFFTMDLLGFLRLGCISGYQYSDKLLLAFLLPLLMVICVTGIYFVRRSSVENMQDRAVKMGFAAVFLVYAFLTQTVFEAFACRDLGEGIYLAVDYQTSCEGSAYTTLVIFGVIGVLAYPIAVPVLTMYVLYNNRAGLVDRESPTFNRYSFLVADYTPRFWYWECIEMLRKVMLTGVISVFRRGSLFQLVVGAMLSLISLTASAKFEPYDNKIANHFKVATEASLVATLVLAILLKISTSDLEKEGLSHKFVGGCMLVETLVLPLAALGLSAFLVAHEVKDAQEEHVGISDIVERARRKLTKSPQQLPKVQFANPLPEDSQDYENPLHPDDEDSNDEDSNDEDAQIGGRSGYVAPSSEVVDLSRFHSVDVSMDVSKK
jgi:hypothetical protein